MRSFDRLIYCIGSTKCGTSWIHRILAGHPEIHSPPGKEVHYWDTIRPPFFREPTIHDRLAQLKIWPVRAVAQLASFASGHMRSKYKRLRLFEKMYDSENRNHEAYRGFLLNEYSGQKTVIDCTPNYVLLGRTTFEEMLGFHPNSYFLMVIRDPVDRLWSSVRFENRSAAGSNEIVLEKLVKRFQNALSDECDPLLRKSRYDLTLTALEASVPRDRIHVIFYENLHSASTWDSIFEFIGVPPIPVNFDSRINVGRDVGGRPDELLWNRAREVLAPTYDMVRQRFGAEVPESWEH